MIDYFAPKIAEAGHVAGHVDLIPNAKIPGLENVESFTDFVAKLLPQIITVLIILTVISLAWYGVQYITSNIPGMKGLAKVRLWEIIFGLLIILGAYLILYTINPNINRTNFDPRRAVTPTQSPTINN